MLAATAHYCSSFTASTSFKTTDTGRVGNQSLRNPYGETARSRGSPSARRRVAFAEQPELFSYEAISEDTSSESEWAASACSSGSDEDVELPPLEDLDDLGEDSGAPVIHVRRSDRMRCNSPGHRTCRLKTGQETIAVENRRDASNRSQNCNGSPNAVAVAGSGVTLDTNIDISSKLKDGCWKRGANRRLLCSAAIGERSTGQQPSSALNGEVNSDYTVRDPTVPKRALAAKHGRRPRSQLSGGKTRRPLRVMNVSDLSLGDILEID